MKKVVMDISRNDTLKIDSLKFYFGVKSRGAVISKLLKDYKVEVNVNTESNSVNTNGLTGKPNNGDFTTAYNSSTTILCGNLPAKVSSLTDADIVTITQIASDGSVTATYYRDDSTISVSGNIITVSGASFSSTDSFVVQTNISDPNAYDPSTNSQMTSNLNPLWERYTDAEELVSAQDLTSSYADFGSEIDMRGYNTLGVFIVEDVNDSQDVDLKLLAKDEFGGTDEYDIDSIPVERLWSGTGTDAKKYYQFDTDSIPIIQIQAKAGTVGSTAGNLTLKIVKMWM